VLGERAISAAARGARECGVSQRTAAIYSGSVPARAEALAKRQVARRSNSRVRAAT